MRSAARSAPSCACVDDRVEQLVDRDEVRAAHVPVRLLAVHGEGLEPEHDRGEELGGPGGDRRVGGCGGGGLRLGHRFASI